jgi:uncharacterized protein (DUF4415 family)
MEKKKRAPIEMTYDDGVTAGDVEVPGLDEALKAPGKLRITTMIDEDIYDKLREKSGGKGYQTLLNAILRQYFSEDQDKAFERKVLAVLSQGRGKQMMLNLLGSVTSKARKKAPRR